MKRRRSWGVVAVVVVVGLAAGCAVRFSPEVIRQELISQRGRDPLSVFELNLGRFTTMLIKSVLAGEDGELPFAGLSELQLSVYEMPPTASEAPAMDVTLMGVQGWEPVVRLHDEKRSAMVLVRSGRRLPWATTEQAEGTIADLVVVGAGKKQVVYARLQGLLSAKLPAALGDVLRTGGPEEIQRVLTNLAETGGSAP